MMSYLVREGSLLTLPNVIFENIGDARQPPLINDWLIFKCLTCRVMAAYGQLVFDQYLAAMRNKNDLCRFPAK